MEKLSMKGYLLFAVAFCAVVVGGLALGPVLGRYKLAADRTDDRASYQSYLEENILGIEVGKMFPDIPVWSIDGTSAYGIHELLPAGGMLLYVSSGCEACARTLKSIGQVREARRGDSFDVILVVRGDPGEFTSLADSLGTDVPMYHDAEDAFARVFHVSTFPTAFRLANGGLLTRIVAGPESESDFAPILRDE